MTLRHIPALAVRATVCATTLVAASAAWADSPTWAQAQSVKATSTECGNKRFIVLKATAAKVPIPATEPGCTTSEEVYSKVFVAQGLLQGRAPWPTGRIQRGRWHPVLQEGRHRAAAGQSHRH